MPLARHAVALIRCGGSRPRFKTIGTGAVGLSRVINVWDAHLNGKHLDAHGFLRESCDG